MSFLERFFPGLALRNVRLRILLQHAKRVYDAAKASTYRVMPTDARSADAVMEHAGTRIRKWARYLDENHDLSIGVLDVLVNNIVGTGIAIEPMVMTKGGKTADKVNKEIRKLLKEWAPRPEVTGEVPFGEAQRLICRAWMRDGEALVQHVRGPRFDHWSRVPYSFEMVESDLLPFDPITGRDRVIHGVEKDSWGRPLAYWLYKEHPGNMLVGVTTVSTSDLKRVRADDIVHLKFTRRFRQTRGVSVFHGVIQRLDDIRDYEESERIAARVAASLTAFITRGEDFTGQSEVSAGQRTMPMQPGMIFDNLGPGEGVATVKPDRPNTALGEFVKTQHRGLAAGTGTNYSSIAKDYNGTYSAQRQEMVESQPAYARLREYYIAVFMRRVYRELILSAIASGTLMVPRTVDPDTLFDADMRGPAIPWIDPMKEMQAEALAVEKRFRSRSQVIRDHGGDPDVVEEQIKQERDRDRENGFLEVGSGSEDGQADDGGSGDEDEEAAA